MISLIDFTYLLTKILADEYPEVVCHIQFRVLHIIRGAEKLSGMLQPSCEDVSDGAVDTKAQEGKPGYPPPEDSALIYGPGRANR